MYSSTAFKHHKPILFLLVAATTLCLGWFWLVTPSKARAADWLAVPGASVLPGAKITTFDDDPNVAYVIDNQGRILTSEVNTGGACNGPVCTTKFWSNWIWVSQGVAADGANLTPFSIRLWSRLSYKYITRHFLFVVGTDGRVWYTEKTGYLSYTSWTPLGSTVLETNKLAAVQLGSNHISLFAFGGMMTIINGQIGFSGPIN